MTVPFDEDAWNARQRVQVNAVFNSTAGHLLSNLAETPFDFDGTTYASAEGFIHAIKLPRDDPRRAEVAALSGKRARRRGRSINAAVNPCEAVHASGRSFAYRSPGHFEVIEQALRAKFTQDERAREALLDTGDKRIVHDTGRDESPTTSLPADVFVDMLTRIRNDLRSGRPPTPTHMDWTAFRDPPLP